MPDQSLAFLKKEAELQREAEQTGQEFFWIWETSSPTVVLGRSGKIEAEVNSAACEQDHVPVVRRESGGGAVVLASGCFNYTLVLNLEQRPQLREVERSYELILQSVIRAAREPAMLPIGGDLTIMGKKFGGSSQKRSRTTLLHHGTILQNLDLSLVSRYLREPPRSPAYREGRSHPDFLTNVPLSAGFSERFAAEYPGAQVVK